MNFKAFIYFIFVVFPDIDDIVWMLGTLRFSEFNLFLAQFLAA
jgi:hypothetical protein